ncbi:hypothetical protein AZI87_00915 [Bdellovibrio bacteriovorus]|uniref:Uncharacterized protein n=1 Tax=Bdellovibrio bacteriovorus TaxID=959 RepID=A0A162GDB9_BDEBC|nr:AAA family ATPase [Bdellovibrio bacteriovorus]KYG67869.1 hypothetical protein AZI87_00915 [Bdellovibrio bacteriovorus]
MYIKSINIINFRGIENLVVNFESRFNVLIGENNSGKSSIIDALRICLSYGKNQNDFYIKKSDFRLSSSRPPDPIEFHFEFAKEDEEDLGHFHSLLGVNDDGKETLNAHFKYSLVEKNGVYKIKVKTWGGLNEGNPISADEFNEHIFSVYLDALRDAGSQLRPGRTNKLGDFFLKLEPDSDNQKKLADEVKASLDQSTNWNNLIDKGNTAIAAHLASISLKSDSLGLDLNFLPAEYKKIVDSLVIGMKSTLLNGEVVSFDIAQNGLGLNNLLYSSVILSDIETFKQQEKSSLAALLIEEPEAHLHPQQQNLFFKYLSELSEKSKFQIFITSHSPTITAKSPLAALRCIKKRDEKVKCFTPAGVLSPENQEFLHKFLDTTKSQLFFSNGTILVEGISEALLIPIFAKRLGFDLNKMGIEVVNINGVAFDHFANLYRSTDEKLRMNAKCSILTDDDRSSESEEISSRAKIAKELESGNLSVNLAEKTFEVALFAAGSNKDIFLDIWKKLHPKSKVDANDDVHVYADNFLKKVESNKAKSELAYALLKRLEEKPENLSSFTVPTYIENAIKWVCNG